MLPQVGRRLPGSVHLAVLLLATLLAGCGDRASPEAEVRAVIAAGEQAAEARDVGGIIGHVSPGFRDEHGAGRDELRQYLRAYFATHPSVRLLTRVERIEFPYNDFARVSLTVGSLGTGSAGVTALDLAAEINDVVLELQLEDDEWKVVRAAWGLRRRD